MEKIDNLLKKINQIILKEDDDPVAGIEEFPGIEQVASYIEDYEKTVAKLLRQQKKYYLSELNSLVSKSDVDIISIFLLLIRDELFDNDPFKSDFEKATTLFLTEVIENLTSTMMSSIDIDIQFNELSQETLNWISSWSKTLSELMELKTHQALEKLLIDSIENAETITELELKLKDLSQFDRQRARTTARTEILTASSRAHYESFKQSPAVTGKTWRHSGSKKSNPRETHIAMDGVTIPVEDHFTVDGEAGLYPRDPQFSAKNRVHCGCVLSPNVDPDILKLSKEEKEALREEALKEMED